MSKLEIFCSPSVWVFNVKAKGQFQQRSQEEGATPFGPLSNAALLTTTMLALPLAVIPQTHTKPSYTTNFGVKEESKPCFFSLFWVFLILTLHVGGYFSIKRRWGQRFWTPIKNNNNYQQKVKGGFSSVMHFSHGEKGK